MEKVSGIGGLFFRARDPKALARWYHDHLGVALVPLATTIRSGGSRRLSASPAAGAASLPATTRDSFNCCLAGRKRSRALQKHLVGGIPGLHPVRVTQLG
jgi:hypothetical protein